MKTYLKIKDFFFFGEHIQECILGFCSIFISYLYANAIIEIYIILTCSTILSVKVLLAIDESTSVINSADEEGGRIGNLEIVEVLLCRGRSFYNICS